MTSAAAEFRQPPETCREDDAERRVGFELECAGPTVDQAASALRGALGGRLTGDSAAKMRLDVEELGTFHIEIDWEYLKRKAAEAEKDDAGGEWVELLKSVATVVVPVEVVCPPIPLSRLHRLHAMTDALRAAGAAGTGDSVLAAFGVHINAEAPALDPRSITRYLKAFALLQWWLVDAHEVDLTRRVTPYIDLYPQPYVSHLLKKEAATMELVLADYLAHNPTRNRALDLLPLLANIDEDSVRSVVDDPRIKPRPAFHYRLANCRIEDPDWSLPCPWNTWLVVEQLASRPGDIDRLSRDYLDADRPLIGVSRRDWVERIDRWLRDRG
ncbi:MAG: hypothetical protein DWQ08_13645 [Proteobacteria bacterium]|nr:MAG: hypothetical protein DWQ08_13645 [Pseudomonadota bacterium]